MKIETLVLGDFSVCTYVVSNGNECIIIDPGKDTDKIIEKISGRKLCAILLTHAHFDHIEGLEYLRSKFSAPIYIHENDVDMLGDCEKNLSERFCPSPIEIFSPEKTLTNGEKFTVAGLEFELIHTPGHSLGSSVYRCCDVLFTGDTLFNGCCGRCDLYGSSPSDMRASLDKLFSIKENLKVYPGHSNSTCLDEQRPLYKMFI